MTTHKERAAARVKGHGMLPGYGGGRHSTFSCTCGLVYGTGITRPKAQAMHRAHRDEVRAK